MRGHRWTAALGALALALGGCGGSGGNDANSSGTETTASFAQDTPDFAGVSLDLTGDDGSSADGSLASPLAAGAAASADTSPMLLPAVLKTVKGINQAVAFFVRRIEWIVAQDGAVNAGTSATWTNAKDGYTYRFTITKTGTNTYTYELDAAPGAGASTFTKLLDGQIIKGDLAHRGAGYLDCNLTAVHTLVGAAFPATGDIKVTFAHSGPTKRLHVKLTDYKANDSAQPASAAYVYTRVAAGAAGAIKLAIHANINDPSDATKLAEEWLLIRGRWVTGFKARFDAVAFGGDIPAGTWVRAAECLDHPDQDTFKFVIYRDPENADQSKRSVILTSSGTVDACYSTLRTNPSGTDLPENQDAAEAAASDDSDIQPPAEQ